MISTLQCTYNCHCFAPPSNIWLTSSIELKHSLCCYWGQVIRLITSIHNNHILLVSLPVFVAYACSSHTDNIPNTSMVKSTHAIFYSDDSTLHHHQSKRERERELQRERYLLKPSDGSCLQFLSRLVVILS